MAPGLTDVCKAHLIVCTDVCTLYMHRYVVITPIGDTVRQRLMLLSYHPGRCAEHAAIAKARATRYLVITPAGASCHLLSTLPQPLRSPPTIPFTLRLPLAAIATFCCKVTGACKCG